MAYASRVMRGLIIDPVRIRQAQKRGGEFEITAICADVADAVADGEELTRIGEALDELATVDPRLAQVVDLKFFCGLSFAEIAAIHVWFRQTDGTARLGEGADLSAPLARPHAARPDVVPGHPLAEVCSDRGAA